MNSIPPTRDVDGDSSRPMSVDASAHNGRIVIDAAIFYSVVSLVIAILVAYFRQPFGSPGFVVIAAYWFAAVTAMFAYAAPFLMRYGKGRSGTVALASFLAASALVTVAGYWGLAVAVAVLSIGVWADRRHLRSFALPSVVVMIIAAVAAAIFAAACFVLVNSMHYATVFSPERALAGIHNRDQLFHASIASMFAHYGIAGTGLDGLQPFRYHLLSHIWLGMMAKGFGVNSIFGYFLGVQIVAVPLAYFSVTVATTAFVEPTSKPASLALLLAMPIAVLFAFEHWNWLSYLISESHILGLILLLTALPMLRWVSRNPDVPLPYAIVAIGFAVGVLALAAKVSVGFVWFAGFLYLSVRANRVSRAQLALYGVLLLCAFWLAVTYLLPVEHSESSRFAPFHFFRLYPTAAMANLVPIVLATMVQIGLYRSSSRTERVWRETIVVMLMASAAPTFILQLDGGSAYYFINIGTWIAVAALAGQLVSIARPGSSNIAWAACFFVVVVSWLGQPDRNSALAGFKQERDDLIERVVQDDDRPGTGEASILNRSVLARIAEAMEGSVGGRLSRAFESAGVTAGEDILVFVEPGVDAFWSMHPECAIPQFLVPSYFGVPLLKGLPPVERGCDLGLYYSLPSYGPDAASSTSTESELCRAALARGFSSVLSVSSEIAVRKVACN